jgi:hypothetical protein
MALRNQTIPHCTSPCGTVIPAFGSAFVVADLQVGSRVCILLRAKPGVSARRPQLFFLHVLQGKELGKTRFACVGTAGVIGGLE